MEICQELLETISKNYENESYSSTILDAMYLLTQTIRNRTGLEGDGSSLVGQAFEGDNPKIQLNNLQTASEKDIQKRTQKILKGIYTSIRSPRSHVKFADTKQEADAIISLIIVEHLKNIECLNEWAHLIIRKLRSKNDGEIQFDEKHPWWKVFESELKDYPEIKYIEW